MKPSHWTCGGGDFIICSEWDPVNGCWQDLEDVWSCPIYQRLDSSGENDGED